LSGPIPREQLGEEERRCREVARRPSRGGNSRASDATSSQMIASRNQCRGLRAVASVMQQPLGRIHRPHRAPNHAPGTADQQSLTDSTARASPGMRQTCRNDRSVRKTPKPHSRTIQERHQHARDRKKIKHLPDHTRSKARTGDRSSRATPATNTSPAERDEQLAPAATKWAVNVSKSTRSSWIMTTSRARGACVRAHIGSMPDECGPRGVHGTYALRRSALLAIV
jgi:hypothetical protein